MYDKKPKNVQKSIRMTQEVCDYVNGMEGDGFNEKFENMVIFCMKEKSDIEKEVAQAEERLQETNNRINEHSKIARQVQDIQCAVERFSDDIIRKIGKVGE